MLWTSVTLVTLLVCRCRLVYLCYNLVVVRFIYFLAMWLVWNTGFLHPLSDCLGIIIIIIIIIIHTFLSRHKVVTSEVVAAQFRSCHYCPLLWARWNKWVLSLDLKTVSEVLSRTILGSEFQTAGAEWRKARLAKSVLMEGWANRGVSDDRRFRALSPKSFDL